MHLAVLLFVLAAAIHPLQAAPILCSSQTVSFSPPLLSLVVPTYNVAGTLCVPSDGPSNGRTVVLLVPGATINQIYWNFTYDPQTYNFRLHLNKVGYATFTVDRLGTGSSSKPPGATVTCLLQAQAMHAVVGSLRSGIVGGISFGKVIIGGHSLGSMISVIEAGTYNDVDGVLLTGFSHRPETAVPTVLLPNLTPVLPLLQNAGYLTTVPNTRQACFYSPSIPDPNVVALDEATKDVIASTEIDGYDISVIAPYSLLITPTIPVFIANGKLDTLFCDALTCACEDDFKAWERGYFRATDLDVFLLEDAGHSINLATNTQIYHQKVINWLDSRFGPFPMS